MRRHLAVYGAGILLPPRPSCTVRGGQTINRAGARVSGEGFINEQNDSSFVHFPIRLRGRDK
jgi:hypothetical protein